MLRLSARIALALAALALVAPGPLASGAGTPAGQFQPVRGDRDGDGLPDGSDCAPDDPTRPARSGEDLDCDGAPDQGGAGIPVDLAGPDGGEGPPPAGPQAASRPSRGTVAARASARRAAGEPVVAVRGLRLGPSVAVYAPAAPRPARPALVLVAKGSSGVTVRPWLVFAQGRRALRVRTASLPRGRALVVRIALDPARGRARRVRFAVRVVDGAGATYRDARVVALR